jgi:hypothetical protein
LIGLPGLLDIVRGDIAGFKEPAREAKKNQRLKPF